MTLRRWTFVLAMLLAFAATARAEDAYTLHSFDKKVLTDLFFSEGAGYGDFNHDGKMDIVSGPFWYEGPEYKAKHQFFEDKDAKPFDPHGYSKNFFAWGYDFNADGWDDIIIYGFPGQDASWYENPKGKEGPWVRHKVADIVDNESPWFIDINGDGKPEIVCSTTLTVGEVEKKDKDGKPVLDKEGKPVKEKKTAGFMGYFEADWKDPAKPWAFHKISAAGGWQRFTHGEGVGDVNGDGKLDILEVNGWWEQPADLKSDAPWKLHPAKFGGYGGSQMYVYDVNGDGVNDVVCSLEAHGWGLAWFEGKKDDKGEITFTKHLIMGSKPEENKYGVKVSALHALEMVDIDGDGIKDILTGRRYWAHAPAANGSGGDPEVNGPAFVYWFKIVRNADKSVDFIPHKVDDDSGVGTQVMTGDLNGDKLPDIIVGNKKGTFVFIHKTKSATKEEWEAAQPKVYAK